MQSRFQQATGIQAAVKAAMAAAELLQTYRTADPEAAIKARAATLQATMHPAAMVPEAITAVIRQAMIPQ